MLREPRSNAAAQRGLHGESNQLPTTAKPASPVANENATPNRHSYESMKIKAWKGSHKSSIPSAPSPSAEAVAVTPRQIPVGTTPTNQRVSTLQAIKNHLQDRLENERQLQIDAVKQLEYIGEGDERSADLNNEVCSRGNKIMVLSQKLTRTQHTLGSLQKATNEYEVSAQKVRDAEEMYLSRQMRSSGLSLSSKESKSIRHELDAATAMMTAACQRVEQIESITDTLIKQLSDTENELADLQSLRNTELVKHSAEIEKLAHERDCLALQLAASNSSSEELQKKEKELNLKLKDAKLTAKQLADELQKADNAKAEQEEALKREAIRLQKSLKDVERSKVLLEKELEQKQNDLINAQKRASEGTPKGKGAKQVLPMALKKLKGTQEELLSIKEEKKKAMKDLEYAKQLAKAREETFLEQLKTQTHESESVLSEKQAALESVMKAAAAAANDVAHKQETINNLRMEIATVKESKDGLLADMAAVKNQCKELSQKLHIATENEASALQQIEDLKKRHNESQAAALEKEIVLKTQLDEHIALTNQMKSKVMSLEQEYAALLKEKHQFEKTIGAKNASIARLNAEIASQEDKSNALQASMATDIANLEKNVQSLAEEKLKSHTELKKTLDTISALHSEKASIQASKNEVSGLLSAKEKEIVSLSKSYATQVNDMKIAVDKRDKMIQDLEKECAEQKEQSKKLMDDMEALSTEHGISQKEARKAIDELSNNLKNAEDKYAILQRQYSELEEESQKHLAMAAQEISSLKKHYAESVEIRGALEKSMEEERAAHSLERKRLEEHCDNIERSKQSLLRSIENLDEQLAMKESELVASREVGTPKGEAAKEILQRSLVKVKALQSEISDLRNNVLQKDEKIAELVKENLQIETLKADSTRLQSEIDRLDRLHEAKALDLKYSKDVVSNLEQELRDMKQRLGEETAAKGKLASTLKNQTETWEAELSNHQKKIDVLGAQKIEAEERIKSLSANLDQTKLVLVDMRKKDDANSEVMRLAFEKVKILEDKLAQQQKESAELMTKLQDISDIKLRLQEKINEAERQHASQVSSYDQSIASMETDIAQLGHQLQAEVEKRETLMRELEMTKSSNGELQKNNQNLQCTVKDMKIAMQTFEIELGQKQEALDNVEKAKEALLGEMEKKISAVEKMKESAENSVKKTSEEVEKISQNLAIAKSQLCAYERSMTAKETTISLQKKSISNMEDQAQALRDEIRKNEAEMKARDAKLKQLGQAKISVEIQLGKNIEELKRELAIEKEKSKEMNLTDAAAEKSAQILEQTQIRLAESEKSVRFLVNSTKSMSHDLQCSKYQVEKKSEQIAALSKQLHDQAEAAHLMERSFLERQDELKRALHSAEWLATVTKDRYESQIEDLNFKVHALEKRCEHVEILERQNMELCAIARDRLHTPVELESHRMKDVDTITSPPSRMEESSAGAKTAIAAVTAAAGFMIMSCAARTTP